MHQSNTQAIYAQLHKVDNNYLR